MNYNEKGPSTYNPPMAYVNSVPPSYGGEKAHSPGMSGERIISSEKTEIMFKSTSWRDLWAAILYYLHLIGVAAILGYNAHNLSKIEAGSTTGFSSVIIKGFSAVGGGRLVSLGWLAIFLSLISHFPTSMIKGTFISTIVLSAFMGLGMLFTGSAFIGIMYLIMSALNIFLYFSWRNRIPFSAILLKTVIDVMKLYPSTWNLSLVAIFGQAAFLVLYLTTLTSIGLKYSYTNTGEVAPIDTFSMIYVVFSMFWSNQIVDNVVHTTVCGVFGTFYFLHGTGAAIVKPVWNAFSRSMTYSFGSIAFGSLIVAILQLVRFLINSTRNERDSAAAACADCLIGMIEGLVKYFNYYAYVHVAIYGKPYIESGMDTYELIKSHGVDVIINDCLIDKCMGVGILLISMISALCAYIAGFILFQSSNNLIAGVSAATFLLSAMLCSVATQLIGSGASATLVCFAEDPSALQRSKPELYREITSAYQRSFI